MAKYCLSSGGTSNLKTVAQLLRFFYWSTFLCRGLISHFSTKFSFQGFYVRFASYLERQCFTLDKCFF